MKQGLKDLGIAFIFMCAMATIYLTITSIL